MKRARHVGGDPRGLLGDVARLVVEEGYELDAALHRAARHLGIKLQPSRPSPGALHAAIDQYRQLFRPQQYEQLRERRELARQAMRQFAEFQPRLSGALLHGDGPLDRVRLLLYADTPEQVLIELQNRGIPWQAGETLLHYSGGRRSGGGRQARPTLRFVAGDSSIELVILDRDSRSDPPRDPLSGGALESLDSEQLDALLQHSAEAGGDPQRWSAGT